MVTSGPDERVRMAYIAKLHYLDRHSRVQIAEDLGISRFRVARILEEAVHTGVVRFIIQTPDSLDPDLSMQLRAVFGLTRALVVSAPRPTPEAIRAALGAAAAELLTEIVVEGETIGVTAGRTLGVMSRSLRQLAKCDVVQLAGVAGSVREDGLEATRRVREASGGRADAIYAPLLMPDAATASALRRDPHIRQTIGRFDAVSKAMVAIGSWSPPDSQLFDAAAAMGEVERLLALGVQTEICGTLLDADGRIIPNFDDRMLAISTAQLGAIGEVIAVAGGPTKFDSIRSAIRSGLIHSVVTDTDTARALLSGAGA